MYQPEGDGDEGEPMDKGFRSRVCVGRAPQWGLGQHDHRR
jgi:hypothetical protein